jgi:hypothetical protein
MLPPACAGRRCKRSTPRTQSSGMSCLGAFSPASDRATIEIDGLQHIIHSVSRRPTSCCRGDDGLRERYCSQKEKAHSFMLSVRHSHSAFGRACPIRNPAGRPENPQQSFPSLMKASPAGFLLARPRKGYKFSTSANSSPHRAHRASSARDPVSRSPRRAARPADAKERASGHRQRTRSYARGVLSHARKP